MASLSTDDVTTPQHRCLDLLVPAQRILDLFNHRNKNQHRLSRWWKQFDMLRRSLSKLIVDLEDYSRAEAKAVAKRKKSKKGSSAQKEPFEAERTRMEVRTRYVLEQLVPRAFLAFTQLAADNQYAHLGLALLGVLAQVNDAIAPLVATPEEPMDADKPNSTTIAEPVPNAEPMEASVDIGVAVSRNEVASRERPAIAEASKVEADVAKRKSNNPDEGTRKAVNSEATDATEKPRMKKKRRDEFDDIFGSLETEESTKKKKKKRTKQRDEFDDIFGSLL